MSDWVCENCKFEELQDIDPICKECKNGLIAFFPKYETFLKWFEKYNQIMSKNEDLDT